jgi:osmoprotectant transport system substrate-binding protein
MKMNLLRHTKVVSLGVTGLALAAALAGCGSSSSGSSPSAGSSVSASAASGPALCGGAKGSGNVTLAAFNFSESETLANIYAAALRECGYTVTVKDLASREVIYPALKKGDFAAVPEYAATLTDFINDQQNGANAPTKASGNINVTIAHLRAELPSTLAALTPAAATDKNAFAVTKAFASAHHITTLSQLGAYSKSHPLKLGGPPECKTRPFCQPGLEKTYGMKFSSLTTLDAGGPLTIKAIKTGKVDVGLVFTSDPTPAANGLTVLTDDKNLQASDNIVPVVQQKYATGAFANALNAVDQKLSQSVLIGLNKAVEVNRDPISSVATAFLKQEGLSN